MARRRATPGLSGDRADSIVGGALVVNTAMEFLEADELTVSGTGLREGVALAALGLDPPSVEEVRSSSVFALATRFGSWDPVVAERRAVLASSLQSELKLDSGPKSLERLRHAALLLDIGRSVDYYRRHDHTADVVLTADLDGFSHRKLALLAAVIRAAGDPKFRVESMSPLLNRTDRQAVGREGVVLAIADELERRLPRTGLPEMEFVRGKGRIRLSAPMFDPWKRQRMESRYRRAFGTRLVIDSETSR